MHNKVQIRQRKNLPVGSPITKLFPAQTIRYQLYFLMTLFDESILHRWFYTDREILISTSDIRFGCRNQVVYDVEAKPVVLREQLIVTCSTKVTSYLGCQLRVYFEYLEFYINLFQTLIYSGGYLYASKEEESKRYLFIFGVFLFTNKHTEY